MPGMALIQYGVFAIAAFGIRMLLHWQQTGSTGYRGFSGTPGSPEWFAGTSFALATVAGGVAPALQLARVVSPLSVLDQRWIAMIGVGLFLVGFAGTLWAQAAMGQSWRIGVDPSESTQLVMRGPFRMVRNPIFSFMAVATLGLCLQAPNAIAIVAWVALIGAVELQVRYVEEPYLLRTHDERYRSYASRIGRFVPGCGRLTRLSDATSA